MTLDDLEFQVRCSGFCILPNVIPAKECDHIRESVTATVEQQFRNSSTGTSAAERKVGFTPSVINHDQSFARYLADERLLELVGRLIGAHVRISFTSAIINQPGNERGGWHADWPFNQKNAGHIPAPYPDAIMHLTTLWMLSPFQVENGGTLVLPGSHRCATNPTATEVHANKQNRGSAVRLHNHPVPLPPSPDARLTAEINAEGSAGSVLIMDSRLWHATAPNNSESPRVALAVRYAPWWLNLDVLRPGSDERQRMCNESGANDNEVPSIHRDVYDRLPASVRRLYQHWIEPV